MAEQDSKPDVTSADLVEAAKQKKPTISVKVYAPFQVYYEGDAYSISAENATGPFDILPRHHNFLCMLVPCRLTIDTVAKGQKTIKINRALMHVHENHVSVFVDV